MAGIRQPLEDVLNKLATLQVTNGDAQTVQLYTRVWNEQPRFEEDGKLYDYPKPAAFVEVIDKAEYHEIGIGFRACDIGWRIHLVHEYYNQDGTFEQDLTIFDMRDKVIALLALYQPTACGPMVCVAESQDYTHKNIYHFILDFICHFIDSKGSWYDPNAGKYIYYGPPTGLDLKVTDPSFRDGLLTEDVAGLITTEDQQLILQG